MQLCRATMLRCKLRLLCVLPPPCTTDFHVAESRHCIYFLQHKNCWMRATNLNLQHNIVVQQVAWKYCPYYVALKNTWPSIKWDVENVQWRNPVSCRKPRFCKGEESESKWIPLNCSRYVSQNISSNSRNSVVKINLMLYWAFILLYLFHW